MSTGSGPSGTTVTSASSPTSSRSASAVACDEACTTAPVRTERRSTSPARRTSGCAACGLRRNQQSYTDTSRGRSDGGTT
ncbi:MAG: hypothetical protein QM733_09800 [Ilumatobacteraceae bacterium]